MKKKIVKYYSFFFKSLYGFNPKKNLTFFFYRNIFLFEIIYDLEALSKNSQKIFDVSVVHKNINFDIFFLMFIIENKNKNYM